MRIGLSVTPDPDLFSSSLKYSFISKSFFVLTFTELLQEVKLVQNNKKLSFKTQRELRYLNPGGLLTGISLRGFKVPLRVS